MTVPTFTTWEEAVEYTRVMMAEMAGLSAGIPVLVEDVAQAKLALQAATERLAELQTDAREVLTQGMMLAAQ